MINLILATDNKGGIGYKGKLPWPVLQQDMQRFKELTTNNICIMGSNTWHSLPNKPLPNRVNVVLSTQDYELFPKANLVAPSDADVSTENLIPGLLKIFKREWPTKDIFVIGGKNVYKDWIAFADYIYLTRIQESYDCDVFVDLSNLLNNCALVKDTVVSDDTISYIMQEYKCNNLQGE